MDSSRRACLRTIAALAAVMPISRAGIVFAGSGARNAVPAMLVREENLVESKMFAAGWPHVSRLDLGTDLGQVLFGSAAMDWTRLRAPVLGLTTPRALFCLEQVAAASGVRSVVRLSQNEAETPLIATERLSAFLDMAAQWRPLTPAINTAPDRWVAWLMAPRAALQLDL